MQAQAKDDKEDGQEDPAQDVTAPVQIEEPVIHHGPHGVFFGASACGGDVGMREGDSPEEPAAAMMAPRQSQGPAPQEEGLEEMQEEEEGVGTVGEGEEESQSGDDDSDGEVEEEDDESQGEERAGSEDRRPEVVPEVVPEGGDDVEVDEAAEDSASEDGSEDEEEDDNEEDEAGGEPTYGQFSMANGIHHCELMRPHFSKAPPLPAPESVAAQSLTLNQV